MSKIAKSLSRQIQKSLQTFLLEEQNDFRKGHSIMAVSLLFNK